MTAQTTLSPTRALSKKVLPKRAPKSGQGKSRPVPVVTTPAPPLVIAASKPRNPIAVDALLKKSGPHDDKRRARKLRANERLQSGLDEVRKRNADD